MSTRFHDHWAKILLRAWSVRFMLAAGLCDAVALGVTFFTDAPEPYRSILASAGMAACFLAVVARLMPQGNLPAGDGA